MRPELLALVLAGGVALAPIVWMRVAWEIQDRRRARRRERDSLGLPEHERCECRKCVAWRAVPSNLAGMR